MEFTGNLVVLHTLSGMANALATEVDRLHHPSLLGCVAGDDTILIVSRDAEGAAQISEQIKDMIRHRTKNPREGGK